ncbi:NlpC/P60 family protein [Streptomyces sp. NPDC051315]|uniref:C40 family peptidase n=1 Tax=Streptomyces sp. NPDC051315 TaxID=3365650 RepID=UPI0037966430
MATDRTPLPTGPGSARFEDMGEPSHAEIQQRVRALYDRAETDTGTFNATRAMKSGRRRTVTSVANSGRRAADPSLEAVARQWFDVARSRLGPTAPASLPSDRLPERPARPARPQRPAGSDAVRELEAAGGRLELEAVERRGPEPTGRAVAALPAAPAPRQEEPRALLPAPSSAPAAARPGLRNTKEQIRRKLTTAREVLARGVAQPVASLLAIESRPAERTWEPVGRTWDTGELPAYPPTTDTWSGQWTGLGSDASGTTDADGLAPTTGTGLPAAARGTLTPEPVLQPPVSGFPAPETGLLAASYGLMAPSTGLPTPQAALPAPDFALTTPQAALPAPDLALPTPEAVLPAPDFTPPTPQAAVSAPDVALPTAQATLPAPEFVLPTSQAALPASEFALPVPGTAVPAAAVSAPAPALAPSAPVQAPTGATTYGSGPAYLGKAEKALAFARAQIGRPCVWGATGPESYDCSSLTQAAWKAAGVTLPRASVDQARAFPRVGHDDLRPGDLVFFFDDLSHTGLCTGNGMMIHAPGPGASIREESVHDLGEGALRGAVRPA